MEKQSTIELIKLQYPPKTRIRLGEMKQGIGMPEGAEGTVDQVDDMGHLHMKWDNGSLMILVPGQDRFEMISSPGLEPGYPKHVRYFYPATVRYFPWMTRMTTAAVSVRTMRKLYLPAMLPISSRTSSNV